MDITAHKKYLKQHLLTAILECMYIGVFLGHFKYYSAFN